LVIVLYITGFDCVEIHAANGFLINQFFLFMDIGRVDSQPLHLDRSIKDGLNDGSSLDDRCCRLATDVVAAVVDEVGAGRVGVRLSPFAGYTDCTDADTEAHALHLVHFMDKLGVLYCHVVEPRMCANGEDGKLAIPHRLSPFRKAFRGTFIVNGGYDREEGDRVVNDGYADLVSYGRLFLANPDLPERFRKKAGLNKYDRSTFYTSDPVVGYTDYPFHSQETLAAQ
jgi:12-oxophytodienoic acid reductase